jgi:PPOX class probable F420-dependent enzyme
VVEIPSSVRRRLQERSFWHFVTTNDDGQPTATPVWADVDGSHVIVNTAVGRRKERNVRRDPRVALSMIDLDNPYSWVEIRGRVVEFVEGEEADDSIDALTKKYLDLDEYPNRHRGESRVILRIEPTQVLLNTERE